MPGREGFDFYGASQSFSVLAEYLFGKVFITFSFREYAVETITWCELLWWLCTLLCAIQNIANEKMGMTTPVTTSKSSSGGEKMEMTTPVITRRVRVCDDSYYACNLWVFWFTMAFLLWSWITLLWLQTSPEGVRAQFSALFPCSDLMR